MHRNTRMAVTQKGTIAQKKQLGMNTNKLLFIFGGKEHESIGAS